jgi:hypothetical protein
VRLRLERRQRTGSALVEPERSLFLRTDRAQYSLRDSIVIDVGVRNDGREPIYVYNIMAWGFGGGLVLWLRDHDDKVIEPVMRDDTMLPPPPAGDTPFSVGSDPACSSGRDGLWK